MRTEKNVAVCVELLSQRKGMTLTNAGAIIVAWTKRSDTCVSWDLCWTSYLPV